MVDHISECPAGVGCPVINVGGFPLVHIGSEGHVARISLAGEVLDGLLFNFPQFRRGIPVYPFSDAFPGYWIGAKADLFAKFLSCHGGTSHGLHYLFPG